MTFLFTRITKMTILGSPTFASCLLCLFMLGLCSAQTVDVYNSSNFKPGTFIARPMCNAKRQLEMGCMREVSQDLSLSNCCRRCLYATGCIGASVHLVSIKCYLHSQCDFWFGCVTTNTDFNYMEKLAVPTTEIATEAAPEMATEMATQLAPEMVTTTAPDIDTEMNTEMASEITTTMANGINRWVISQTTTEMTREISSETTTDFTTAGSVMCEQGVYDKQTGKCICHYGYSGQRCERNYYDCLEIKQFYPVYFYAHQYHCLPIKPQNHFSAFQMRCEVRNDEAVTYLMLNTGSLNFNRRWPEYGDNIVNLNVNGTYWMGDGSYWMGLEHMYIMLGPSGRTVYLEYFLYNYTNGESSVITHKYTDFRLGDRNTYFQLTYSSHEVILVGKLNVTLSECPAISNMSKFTTLDLNNDNDPDRNCAKTANAGGWFSTCYNVSCNPLGSFYGQIPAPPTENGYVQIPGLDRGVVREQLQSVAMYYIE